MAVPVFPSLTFEVAFGVNPNVVPGVNDWTDLSDRLGDPEGVEWGYGRDTELDRMEAGVGQITLDNADRALDPTNEQSVFWPDVVPAVRCRLTATHNATDYQVLEAFVEGWTPSWQQPASGWVTIPLVDGTKALSLAPASSVQSEEATGTRIGNLLDEAGWPAGRRDLDSGQSTVQALAEDVDRKVLAEIRETESAEFGMFFIDPEGNARFRDRVGRLVGSPSATFGDGAGELPYARFVPSADDAQLWNDIAVTPDGLTAQTSTDSGSIDKYWHRRFPSNPGARLTTEAAAQDLADGLLSRYATPRTRVEQIVLEPSLDADVMTQVLTRVPGDRVRVKRRPPGGGDPLDVEVMVEHVHHRIQGVEWVTSWRLSPAAGSTFWLIGTVGLSEAGTTTVLGW